jgi:DNA-binding CsgD family transcriptional regulator
VEVTGIGDAFVGRQQELALLRARLAATRAGTGHLVLITGPAGIGKTRLIEELSAETSGIPIGWGGAVTDAGMPALWPWVRAVRGLPEPRMAVAALVAGDAQRVSGSAEEAAATTFAGDTAVVDALAEHAGTAGGLVLVLEDLHWADRATLRLLERVAAEIRRMPMLVIGTGRDGTGESLAGLVRHASVELMGLAPLSAGESAALLMAAVEEANADAVRHAAQLSGGSPLYLRTLGRVATGQLRGASPWDPAIGAAAEFRHLVLAALRSAGEEAAAIVEVLSVLGTEPDMRLATAVLAEDSATPEAMQRLLPAVPAGLIEIAASGSMPVRFSHALVRDAVYASLPPHRRIELHRRAAGSLEPVAVARDDLAGAVARHWERAGDPARAAGWAVRAAESARVAGAYDEAAGYLRLALDSVGRGGDGPIDETVDRAELLLDLSRVQYLAGHITESVMTCSLAADEGERAGRADVVARAAITVQGIGNPAVNLRLTEFCRRALAMLDADVPTDLRARVEAQLACSLVELNAIDEATQWSLTALADAAASGDANAELDAIRARVMLHWQTGADHEIVGLAGRAIELAEPTGRPLAQLWAHVWRSDAAIRRVDMGAAQAEVAAMEALADRTGLPLVRWHVLRRRASLAGLTGAFDQYRTFSRQAAELSETWRDESSRGTHFGQSVCVALLRGDPAEIAPGWSGYLDRLAELQPPARAGVAAALLLVGRREEARVLYEPLVAELSGARSAIAAASIAYLVELAPRLGDADGCRALRDWIQMAFGHTPAIGTGTVYYGGSVARVLGELDLGAGDPATAAEHFTEGLRVDAALGARPYVARGRFGLARAVRAAGDLARAIELTRQAAAEARRMDMPGLLRDTEVFLAETAAAARVRDPLTHREHEVVDLIARALSNREVARALVLSERTVESHVRRILAKTGLSSRGELIRWHLQQPPH